MQFCLHIISYYKHRDYCVYCGKFFISNLQPDKTPIHITKPLHHRYPLYSRQSFYGHKRTGVLPDTGVPGLKTTISGRRTETEAAVQTRRLPGTHQHPAYHTGSCSYFHFRYGHTAESSSGR